MTDSLLDGLEDEGGGEEWGRKWNLIIQNYKSSISYKHGFRRVHTQTNTQHTRSRATQCIYKRAGSTRLLLKYLLLISGWKRLSGGPIITRLICSDFGYNKCNVYVYTLHTYVYMRKRDRSNGFTLHCTCHLRVYINNILCCTRVSEIIPNHS